MKDSDLKEQTIQKLRNGLEGKVSVQASDVASLQVSSAM